MFYGQCWKCGERWELGTAPTCVCKDEIKEKQHMNKEDIIRMARDVGWIDYDLAEGREMRLVMFAEHLASHIAAAECETIQDEFWMSLQSDLEHGVKYLNEKAAAEYHKNYPALVEFAGWLRARGNHANG